jgi:hypothetical protein
MPILDTPAWILEGMRTLTWIVNKMESDELKSQHNALKDNIYA